MALRVPPMGDLSFHVIMLTSRGRSLPSTRWVGWADDGRRVELRVADPVDLQFATALGKIGIEPLFVVDGPGVVLFTMAGGAALIEQALAEEFFPELIEPMQSVVWGRAGFVLRAELPPSAFQRAPTRKVRMAVLKRDSYRCAVCGRRPADYIDVELEVHHVRPWGKGGVTHEPNLLTLCQTCHDGLDPHFEHALFDLLDSGPPTDRYRDFGRDTLAYREHMERFLTGASDGASV